ncbi:fluoride efflux transporter FluC [Halocatena pleomorpha]|uniref:Fluoride-specific ion channel FluC n=1 Tax=Halocatena pleomorpha TaxID=1785090 RepID=A0A3P3RF65_9EURY|nr:CrcB family protein [Halocatena pleomorpha]RRJ31063.1 CrcB family protein [Halocatena pleomorpha]
MTNEHPLVRLETAVLIGIGGFAGSNLRYFLDGVVPGPQVMGTLGVNAVGSVALGFILYEAMHSGLLGEQTRTVAATGFLSSFTTYSTFAVQTTLLGSPLWMLLNVLGNYALGFAGVLAGRELARAVKVSDG